MDNEALLQYLKNNCSGSANVRKSADLERELHLSANELRRRINRLRRKGNPIGSSRDGYFYAVTAGEVYSTIRQLTEMESGLEAAIQGLESALDRFGEEVGTSE